MKIVIPYVGELRDLDAHMLRLAEFLGIRCDTVALTRVYGLSEFLQNHISDQCSCFVINPQVMQAWFGRDGIPADVVDFLVSRFSHLLVYGLRTDSFDSEMVAALSRGKLQSLDEVDGDGSSYVVARDSEHICDAFSGLSFGPVNRINDHVFRTSGCDPAVEELISIGGRPFMAAVRMGGTEILFVASENVASLNDEVGDAPLPEYFSRLVPHAMALRHAAGKDCWRPGQAHASIIIDDPLLRKRYGFLNFESLLRLADQHNFHATIAFIPHNCRRNSTRITRMFRANAGRLSLCFHGNDHTEAEFASTDMTLLNTLLTVAEDRMNLHYHMTGLACDRVMVFPQGHFSIAAMAALKAHNFHCAVNTVPYPAEHPVRLTIGELAQPAVLRYGGFPLFVRRPIRRTESHDIAFNLFFGRPVLIVEHHEIFRHPDSLVAIAARINDVASNVHWSNLSTVACNSILTRRAPDGTHHVRAYSRTVRISNESDSTRRYWIEWAGSRDDASIEQVLMDGTPCSDVQIDDTGLRLPIEFAPGSSGTFSVVHRNIHTIKKLGMRQHAQAFLRRRLSEVRDNYLSKNRHLLAAAKALQKRLQGPDVPVSFR